MSSSNVTYRSCFMCFLESNMFSANMVRQYSFLNQVMTELEADPTQVCFLCPFDHDLRVVFLFGFSSAECRGVFSLLIGCYATRPGNC